MPPLPATPPSLEQYLSPLLMAFGVSHAQVTTTPPTHPQDAIDLATDGARGFWLHHEGDLNPSIRHAIACMTMNYQHWLALYRDHKRLREVYDRTFEFQATLNPDSTLIDVNATLLAFGGAQRHDVLGQALHTAPWWDRTPENLHNLQQGLTQAGAGTFIRVTLAMVSQQGAEARVDCSLTPILNEDGQVEMLALEGRDITAHLRTLQDVELARAFLETVLDNVQDGIIACDASGTLTVSNRLLREWAGAGPTDPPETFRRQMFEPDGITPISPDQIPLVRAFQGEWIKEREMVMVLDNRSPRTVLASGGPLRLSSGQRLGAVLVMHDITERKRIEGRLKYDARHDRLTGLPNRALLYELLGQSIARYERRPEHAYAVLFLDLDNFKDINDAYGHIIGDSLLLDVAARLKGLVRKTDVVARLGGDEFAILLDAPCAAPDVVRVMDRIKAAMNRPFNLSGQSMHTTASIGAVTADAKYRKVEEPLRDADTAMYRAKRAGKNRTQLFDQSMHEAVIHRLTMERELREAIKQDQLVLHYQPIIHLVDGHCVGFEALVRWQHPSRGLLFPGDFIEIAEASGLIGLLGLWVLQEAARQLRVWQSRPELAQLQVAVNLSGHQLRQTAQTRQNLLDFDFPAGLELEVTESTLIDEPEAVELLHQLAALGIPLSLDDFGTGFASLDAVQRHPISTLKIDRHFIAPLPAGVRQCGIIASVLTLARHLDLRVIAEGLETPDQVHAVMQLGCQYGQGYLFSRPVPAEIALNYALAHQHTLSI